MKQYLAQINNPSDTKKYHIYFIHEPTIFYILEEWINYQSIGLNDFQRNLNPKKIILSSKINDQIYLSLGQMKRYKDVLAQIHDNKEKFTSITIFYFLEHPALSKIDTFFPDPMIDEREWSIHYLPEIEVNPVNIVSTPSDQLFKPFSQCLYDEPHYKKIVQKEAISQNKHFLSLHLKNDMENLHDMMQYSSIEKIQNEKKNVDRILSNLSKEFLYPLRKAFVLKGEYTGALSSCADTFDYIPLGDILQKAPGYKDLRTLFQSIFDVFEKLYSLNTNIKEQAGVPAYIEKMIPVSLEITYLEPPFVETQDPVTCIKWNDMSNLTSKKKCILKLLDIIPDFKNRMQYTLLFGIEVQMGDAVSLCRVSYVNKASMWRDNFNASGIAVGKHYRLKNVRFESCLSYFLDSLSEIQAICAKENSNQSTNTHLKKDYVQLNLKNYLNPAEILQNTDYIGPMTEDCLSLAHGNINLDNILIFTKYQKTAPVLFDLSALDMGYPLACDMVALEMEIKKHIIANHLLINLYKNQEKQLIDFLITIEESINSEGENLECLKNTQVQLDPSTMNRINQMINIILIIRKQAYGRYKQSPTDQPSRFEQKVKKRYRQQLFFYSIRMLEHSRASKPIRFCAAITSIITAGALFGSMKDQKGFQPTEQYSDLYVKKNIFISYCHEDKNWLKKIIPSLEVLKHKNIHYWYDKEIKPGTEWDVKIHAEIEKANLIICLISQDFLQSNYVRDYEIPAMLHKYSKGTPIIPILLDNCIWQQLEWLKDIQMYPPKCIPLNEFSDNRQNELIHDIVQEVAALLGAQ